MRWLPLVAMVIASALPFPHDPANARRHPASPADDSLRGNALRPDAGTADAPQNHRGPVRSSVHRETSTARVESQITSFQTFSLSGSDDRSLSLDFSSLRTEELPEGNAPPQDHNAGGSSSRKASPGGLDPTRQDLTESPLQISTVEIYDVVSPATLLRGQRGLEPTAPSGPARNVPQSRTGTKTGPDLTLEAGPGLRAELDGPLEGDDVFLNAHPRVLFSSSLSPPEHPPLLLMLESGLLEGDGDGGEDLDGHTEGHGDRAIERSTTPSWADYSRAGRPVRRDKRSHLMDRRRGEKAVCESESEWVIDKTTATDSHGQVVTVLPEIQTQTGPIKQYFYETRCREDKELSGSGRRKGKAERALGTDGARCFGVDNKQWHSECKGKQSYVRALTKDANNRVGWRWIRIDSSCVCVLLSRTPQGKEVLPRRGRG